jgi:hypothetical protein
MAILSLVTTCHLNQPLTQRSAVPYLDSANVMAGVGSKSADPGSRWPGVLIGEIIMVGRFHHAARATRYTVLATTLMIGHLFSTLFASNYSHAAVVVVTPEYLGNPFATTYYPDHRMARNVWDMKVYNGRIYLGNGDSGLNTGPTPMVYFDTITGQFVNDGYVDDESISHFSVVNGILTAPGDDAREAWTFSNYYTRDAIGWTKHRTLPNGLHTNYIYFYEGKLFASYSTQDRAPILISSDNGATWYQQFTNNWGSGIFFELDGNLYTQTFPDDAVPPPPHFFRYNKNTSLFEPAPGEMFPDSGTTYVPLMKDPPVNFRGGLVYTGSHTGNIDNFGLWVASRFGNARKVSLPNSVRTRDVISSALNGVETVLVLTSTKQPSGQYLSEVYSSTDLQTWRQLFQFSTSTFVRSFEYFDGYFYFGLGGYGLRTSGSTSVLFDGGSWNENSVDPSTGDILRVRYPNAVSLPTPTSTSTATSTRTSTPTPTPIPTTSSAPNHTSTPALTILPSPTRTTMPISLRTPTSISISTPTSTPIRTATSSPTLLMTTTPMPAGRIGMQTSSTVDNRLQVTLSAGPQNCVPTNSLLNIRFGEPRLSVNELIDLPDIPAMTFQARPLQMSNLIGRSGQFALSLPAGLQQFTFYVRRALPGQATTVFLKVQDGCGWWETFVGGGAGA